MMAFALDRRFAKQIDYHSSGRDGACGATRARRTPFGAFMFSEAVALSVASGYNGDERPPTAEGEHYEWEFAQNGSHSFLIETSTQFQPPFGDALFEAGAGLARHPVDAGSGRPGLGGT